MFMTSVFLMFAGAVYVGVFVTIWAPWYKFQSIVGVIFGVWTWGVGVYGMDKYW